jgi:hypothetical protein
MRQNTEYGWFSDIESNPDVIYVEYEHIASKGIYKVRNVHVQFPSPQPIEISLTGEKIQNGGSEQSGTYNISQTHYIDVPHIIYINEQHPEEMNDPSTTDDNSKTIQQYGPCIQVALYLFTACSILLICWC